MKRKRFSVEQIVAMLKQAELGVPGGTGGGADPAGGDHRTNALSLKEAVQGIGNGSGPVGRHTMYFSLFEWRDPRPGLFASVYGN